METILSAIAFFTPINDNVVVVWFVARVNIMEEQSRPTPAVEKQLSFTVALWMERWPAILGISSGPRKKPG